MIARLGAWLTRVATRVMPDPFVLAIGLTLVVLALGAWRLAASGAESIGWTLVEGWTGGFASTPLLAFALQMCLVLVTGHALATSPPVRRGVAALARLRLGLGGSAALVAFVSCLAATLHWGLGAIVGAFLAREVGRVARREGREIHYPLLGAAAYSGFAVWHGGLSGSAPLKVAEEGHFAAARVGVIGVERTLLSPLNLAITGGLLVLIPLLFWAMAPKEPVPAPPVDSDDAQDDVRVEQTAVARLQRSPWFGGVVGTAGVVVAFVALVADELALNLDFVNLVFLFAGLAAQGSVSRYVDAVADGARGAGAIVVQFPLYFGVLGVMKASGLILWLSEGFVAIASRETFPLFAFLGAGTLNLFVPSGGGQWAVQGELLFGAGEKLGVDPAVTVMAFSYGDAWTNLLQPFWALPLLGIMGLRAKDIVGYTGVACLAMGAYVATMLALLT
ncbi:MAG: short-chain fatty acid transporter [Sandaracinus sp.]|nr:short-chain fatty acid transporter [Sandaracinus sp.]